MLLANNIELMYWSQIIVNHLVYYYSSLSQINKYKIKLNISYGNLHNFVLPQITEITLRYLNDYFIKVFIMNKKNDLFFYP